VKFVFFVAEEFLSYSILSDLKCLKPVLALRASDQPAKRMGCYVPGSPYYDYEPGLGQGDLKLWSLPAARTIIKQVKYLNFRHFQPWPRPDFGMLKVTRNDFEILNHCIVFHTCLTRAGFSSL
jgi:hypothetical protein